MGYIRIMTGAVALLLGIISVPTVNIIAQTNQATNGGPTADSASNNITTQIMPQGTSLETDNNTKASPNNTPTSSSPSGNVTSEIAPQGTSLQEANQTSTKKIIQHQLLAERALITILGNVNGNNEQDIFIIITSITTT